MGPPLLFSFLCLLLQHRPALLYTLRSCTFSLQHPNRISCDGLKLSRIPSNIPSFAVELKVSKSNIHEIQQSDFRGLNRLKILNLEHNQISRIEDGAFSHLSDLTELDLPLNKLTRLTNNMFTGLCSLKVLDLKSNRIEFISEFSFGPLGNLQALDLSGNFLSSNPVIVNILLSCPSLQSLHLSFNQFTSFESEHFPSPLNISEFDFGDQPLRSFVLHSDVFPRLESLYLSGITWDIRWDVSKKTFLKNVKSLDLSFTDFTNETYQSVFKSVSSLQNLRLRGVHMVNRGLLDFACAIPSLRTLDLSSNNISLLDNSLLRPCTHLTDLALSFNSMTHTSESSLRMLTHLSFLRMQKNRLTRVPLTIRNMSSLTTLVLSYNRIEKIDCLDFANLWHLTELYLNNNRLIELNSCVFQDLHSLKSLDLDYNFLLQFDDGFGTSLSNLLFLSAGNNNIDLLQNGVFKNMSRLKVLSLESVRGTLVEEGAWDGLTNLTLLSYCPQLVGGGHLYQQSYNLPSLQRLLILIPIDVCLIDYHDLLQGLPNLKEFNSAHLFCKPPPIEIFHNTPLLKSLIIDSNDDLNLDPELFQTIRHIQSLELSNNHLKSLDFLSQANLTELHSLDLSGNELRVINELVFEKLPSLKYLKLLDNPFVCNCSNAGFIHWVLSNKQVFVDRAFQFKCASPPSHEGQSLLGFDFQSCWDFPSLLCFLSSSVLVLLTVLSSFLYHFLRWQLVYSFYLLRAYLYHNRKEKQGYGHTYDAFVSYNVDDEDWVYSELVSELEERQGWRLCLHHRDFQPGRAILENITDAIYSSRKTLCVISHRYLQSEWCSREIQMASFRLLDEQKDVLILLFLEELPLNQLSPFYRMRKLLRRRTYLSWSQARSHRGLFWERLRVALQCGAEISNNPLPDQV